MDYVSLRVILTVAIPETLMFILLVAVMTNRLDLINIKKPEKLIRLLITLAMTTAVPVILRRYSDVFSFNQLVQLVFFVLIYTLVLKMEWYNACFGFIVTFIISTLFELISIMITIKITGIPFEAMYTNDNVRLMFSLPPRIFDIIAFLLLFFILRKYRFSLIDMVIFKFTLFKLKGFSIIHILLAICFINIMQSYTYYVFGLPESIKKVELKHMFISTFLTLFVSAVMVVIFNKFGKKVENEQTDHLHSLLLIRTLLSNDDFDEAKKAEIIKIINNSISSVGVDNHKE